MAVAVQVLTAREALVALVLPQQLLPRDGTLIIRLRVVPVAMAAQAAQTEPELMPAAAVVPDGTLTGPTARWVLRQTLRDMAEYAH